MENGWKCLHNPQTCLLCADKFNIETTLVTYDECIKHLLFKVVELEARLQSIEWRNQPIGPGSELSQQGQLALDRQSFKKALDASALVDLPKSPAFMTAAQAKAGCEQCFDEFGSLACLRPAHGDIPEHKHRFMPPSNDDEQQCDADCRANWHKCEICGKTRAELGLVRR